MMSKGGFREGRGCVDQIFTLKQIGEKTREKNLECMWVLLILRRRTIGSVGMLCWECIMWGVNY